MNCQWVVNEFPVGYIIAHTVYHSNNWLVEWTSCLHITVLIGTCMSSKLFYLLHGIERNIFLSCSTIEAIVCNGCSVIVIACEPTVPWWNSSLEFNACNYSLPIMNHHWQKRGIEVRIEHVFNARIKPPSSGYAAKTYLAAGAGPCAQCRWL